MQLSPHLPPPTCSIHQHHRWQRIKIILLATFFGVLAGGVGALMVIGWIWPTLGEGDSWILARANISPRSRTIETAISKTSDTVLTLYQKSTGTGAATYLAQNDKLGIAVMAVSEGWAVAYVPGYSGNFKDWRLVAHNNGVYKAQRVLFDSATGFAYIKIVPASTAQALAQQFKVATFNEEPGVTGDVYVYQDGTWYSSNFIDVGYEPTKDGHIETVYPGTYILQNNFKTGSLVSDNQGRVIGFIEQGSVVAPAVHMGRVLFGIENKTAITYSGLGVQGWFSVEQPIIINGEQRDGFFVTKIINKKSVLKKGDVIMAVNGRLMNPDNMWYTNIDTSVRLQVWRDGKTSEITATVMEL